ncbi:hypothetical protein DIJ64_01025 [Mycobacterium leprae]|uniref:Uncharacterized protein n=1 Tax=Mycobacterium leprae TaxID=1769 RepID=A0AAD0KTL3_MYCLR|nr:hypothetical protein DIJ64_01025 [Mycobacterium leprae]
MLLMLGLVWVVVLWWAGGVWVVDLSPTTYETNRTTHRHRHKTAEPGNRRSYVQALNGPSLGSAYVVAGPAV